MIPLTFVCQSLLSGTAVISLLVLVVIIIFEAKLINAPLEDKPFGSLKYLTVINLLAALSGITFMFIFNCNYEMRHEKHFNGIIVLLCWLVLPLILIGIEYVIYQGECKGIHKRKLLGSLASINITSYIIFSLLILFIHSELDGIRRNAPRISCTSNLKQIGLALKQYAMDYDDYLPDKQGIEGLEQLRSNGYETYNNIYQCPSCSPRKIQEQKLTEEIVDYIYRAGLQDPPVDGKDSSKIPVIWDKLANHENYGNVLFLDGHVEGFKGADWMEQAGIKKSTIQQGE